MSEHVRVAIIGGGPSGLTAAAALAGSIDGEVRVIEREAQAGGIPRHSDHPGYGIRDLHRFMSGPSYARRLDAAARSAGVVVETEAMVTGWAGERRLEVTSPRGRRIIEADAVVLATGARERPRSARLIPGDRPAGVFTTGQLQNMVHLHHRQIGRRAVIIGAELVSWSAALTLREAGCKPVLMTSSYPKSESYAAFRLVGSAALRVKVSARTRLVRINGRPTVESVELENLDTGRRWTVECDTVITTGDWIPDNELVRAAGIEIDASTLGPRVDPGLSTSAPGVFAIGNLVHPVDTADVAAIDGRHVVRAVTDWLTHETTQDAGPRILVEAPLRWVTPQVFSGQHEPARAMLSCWSDEFIRFPTVTALQDGRTIGCRRVVWPCTPGRVFRVPASVLRDAVSSDGPITLYVT